MLLPLGLGCFGTVLPFVPPILNIYYTLSDVWDGGGGG